MSIFRQFNGLRVLVVGDLMVDRYIYGNIDRISQEAPVMVLRETSVDHRPGGAANVAFNLRALGAEVFMVGVTGADAAGHELAVQCRQFGLQSPVIITDPGRPTTTKTRFLADRAHQILRWDAEETHPIYGEISHEIEEAVRGLADMADIVLFSDYQKGVVTPSVVAASEKAKARIANAKPSTIGYYRGFDAVTLNRPETTALIGHPFSPHEAAQIAADLAGQFELKDMIVTLSGDGLANRSGLAPAYPVDVFDAAGAGDTTVATLALYLAAKGSIDLAGLRLAALTSAAVVRKSGVAIPTDEDLIEIDRVFSQSVN